MSVECCPVEVSASGRSLIQGSLSTAVRRYVWFRNLKDVKAMARVGQQRHVGEGVIGIVLFYLRFRKSFLIKCR